MWLTMQIRRINMRYSKNKKYVSQFFYVLVYLFCFSNIAMAASYVNFSLNVEPLTAKNVNPVFEIWTGYWTGPYLDRDDKVGSIQSGGSIFLSKNSTYYLIVPDISDATGCSMPVNEDLKIIWLDLKKTVFSHSCCAP